MSSRTLYLTVATICFAVLCPLVAQAQILDIGTAVNYTGPYPGGIQNTSSNSVTVVGLKGTSGGGIFSGTGGVDDNAVVINGTSASIGSSVSGLFVDSEENTVELSVGSGMESHGLFIDDTHTVLSGGTDSTTLTLDDSGATFENTTTGGPAVVHGVANGVDRFDAVNVEQLQHTQNRLSGGIASVAALAAIPGPAPCKNYSVGIGFGNYMNESAGAVGIKGYLPCHYIEWALGAGFSNSSSPAYSAGIGFGF